MTTLSPALRDRLYTLMGEAAAEGLTQQEVAHLLLGFAHALMVGERGASGASVWLANRAMEADAFAQAAASSQH